MHRHDHIAKGWHFVTGILMATARLTPRRLWVIATLALVLAIGIAGQTQTPRVQAAPAGDASIGIWLYAEQVGGKRTLCVGDVVVIRVSVLKRIGVEGEYMLGRLVGVEVGAFVDGSGVGTISPARNSTRMDSNPMGVTYFTFSAEKPGTITVRFQAKVNRLALLGLELGGDTVTASVPLTVEDCKYKVTTISRWHVPGPAETNIVALIDEAGMTEDRAGHYVGTASVTWQITTAPVGDCSSTQSAGPSQARLTGQVYDYNQLLITAVYDPVMVSNYVDCREIAGHADWSQTPYALAFSVHVDGGATREVHGLHAPKDIFGSTVLLLKRATGQ